MEFETLLVEKSDGVATLTLNRPARHNALTLTMARELRRFWELVKADPEVVCIIVTGAGEKALCTGMDGADVASGAASDRDADPNEQPWLHLTAIHNRCWQRLFVPSFMIPEILRPAVFVQFCLTRPLISHCFCLPAS